MNAFVLMPIAIAACSLVLPAQGGVRCSSTVAAGGTLHIDVASNDPSVSIVNGTNGDVSSHPVGPGKRVTVPVPPVAPGTILMIVVCRGLNAKIVLVEVLSP